MNIPSIIKRVGDWIINLVSLVKKAVKKVFE